MDMTVGRIRNRLVGLMLLGVCLSGCAVKSDADHAEYVPPGGRGQPVIVLSGSSGTNAYVFMAEALSAQGYYVALFNGHEFLAADPAGDEKLRQTILRMQRSPHAEPGKVAVIGLSLGGGDVLAHASIQADLVNLVVAYYPATGEIPNEPDLVRRWTVPTLVFAGGSDTNGCCLIGRVQTMATAAKDRGAPFDLIVYPDAGHGFNLYFNYNAPAAADAWQRTIAALRQHQGT